MPGYTNPVLVRGWGGFGRGRGWRLGPSSMGLSRWAGYGYPYGGWAAPYGTSLTAQEEMNILKDQTALLKKQLEDIESRISTLEKTQSQENK